jgi:hypothetical protein
MITAEWSGGDCRIAYDDAEGFLFFIEGNEVNSDQDQLLVLKEFLTDEWLNISHAPEEDEEPGWTTIRLRDPLYDAIKAGQSVAWSAGSVIQGDLGDVADDC